MPTQNTPTQGLVQLILDTTAAGCLSRVVLSKCRDRAVSRALSGVERGGLSVCSPIGGSGYKLAVFIEYNEGIKLLVRIFLGNNTVIGGEIILYESVVKPIVSRAFGGKSSVARVGGIRLRGNGNVGGNGNARILTARGNEFNISACVAYLGFSEGIQLDASACNGIARAERAGRCLKERYIPGKETFIL